MRKIEIVTIAVGVLFVVFLGVLFGFHGIVSIAGIAICTSLIFVAVTLHLQKKGFRIPVFVRIVRFFLMLSIIVVFVAFVVFIGINIPKEPYFEDKMQLASPEVLTPPRYTQFMKLLSVDLPELNSEQIDALNLLDYTKANIIQYLAQTSSYRDTLFSYLSMTPIELPGAQRALIETQTAEYSILITAVKAEATEVRWLYVLGQPKKAKDKYIRLWKSIEMMCRGKNSIIHTMYTIMMTDIAINVLENDRIPGVLLRNEILLSLRYVRNSLPHAFHDGLILEYEMLSRILRDIPRHIPYIGQEGLPMMYALNTETVTMWPFYDVNKTRRVLHNYYETLTVLNEMPYYRAEPEIVRLNEEFRKSVTTSTFSNKTGKTLLARVGVEYGMVFLKKEALLGRLAVVDTVLSAVTFDETRLPEDPLTGSTYRVRYSRDMIAVISMLPDSREERIVFAWEK